MLPLLDPSNGQGPPFSFSSHIQWKLGPTYLLTSLIERKVGKLIDNGLIPNPIINFAVGHFTCHNKRPLPAGPSTWALKSFSVQWDLYMLIFTSVFYHLWAQMLWPRSGEASSGSLQSLYEFSDELEERGGFIQQHVRKITVREMIIAVCVHASGCCKFRDYHNHQEHLQKL